MKAKTAGRIALAVAVLGGLGAADFYHTEYQQDCARHSLQYAQNQMAVCPDTSSYGFTSMCQFNKDFGAQQCIPEDIAVESVGVGIVAIALFFLTYFILLILGAVSGVLAT